MKIKVWGSRGSIPSPGKDTVKYGGESTCLELVTQDNKTIIIDAGSGLRKLGQQILKQNNTNEIALMLTHAHWDHLAGFPFFRPAYFSNYKIYLCAGGQPQDSLLKYLKHQMDPPYFPVEFSKLKSKIISGCRCENGNCDHKLCTTGDSIKCYSIPLNHPNGGYGFKFIEKNKSFVFLTDNEIRYSHPGGLERKDYVEFSRNADVLFHDANYNEKEYEKTIGWGHSTCKDAIDLAIEAGVKRLGLFHHDPDRSDSDLDEQMEWCENYIKSLGSGLDCFACYEGMVIEI